jgi:hypothetical protein
MVTDLISRHVSVIVPIGGTTVAGGETQLGIDVVDNALCDAGLSRQP